MRGKSLFEKLSQFEIEKCSNHAYIEWLKLMNVLGEYISMYCKIVSLSHHKFYDPPNSIFYAKELFVTSMYKVYSNKFA